jgi:hypothetical protein
VDTDRPIKVLFERQSQSLLPFVGETGTGVSVTAVETVELPVPSRRIDSVLRLERDGFTWFRHLEFESGPDPDMPRRCFLCRIRHKADSAYPVDSTHPKG